MIDADIRAQGAELARRNFINLTVGRALVTIANQGQSVAIAWFVYSLTKDALYLGLVGLAEFLPALIVSFYAGAFVDRNSRKKVYRNSILVSACVPVILFAGTKIWAAGIISPAALLVLIFSSSALSGLARAFNSPAGSALTGEIIPRGQMVRANAWLSGSWQIGVALGPAVGGFIYAGSGPGAVFVAAFFLQVIAAYISEKIVPVASALSSGKKEPFREGVTRAWRFLRNEPTLYGAVLLDMLAVFFGGAVALLPIFAERLGTGAFGLGILRAAPALGSLILSGFLVRRPPREKTGVLLLGSVFGFGVSTIVFALSHNFLLSFVALFLSGAFDAVSVVVRGTLLQLLTPDYIKGRISALNGIFVNSSNEFGEFESGVTAKFMGPVVAAVFGGVMTLVVVLIMTVKFPTLRKSSLAEMEKAAS